MKKELRLKVYKKYDGHCAYCGKEIKYKDMQVDHLTPKAYAHWYKSEVVKRSEGLLGNSVDDFENLMPSCRRCNHYKRASLIEGFRKQMQSLPERLKKQYINKVALDYGIITIHPFNKFYFELNLRSN
jgi:5-methylcytosine-specific restriction endonuclease McrA